MLILPYYLIFIYKYMIMSLERVDIMISHLEIEFKTLIDEKTYNNLLKEFNLLDKTFVQTNYYFDTKNYDLMDKKQF